MPQRILLSGPAAAGKSAEARRLRGNMPESAVVADFQSIYVALTMTERLPDGTYPRRVDALLPMTEAVRLSVIREARDRELDIIATNSDGSPARRTALLAELGSGSREVVVDPGRSVVEARLSQSTAGVLSDDCAQAVNRWYGRLP